ncbi:hypothetical protein Cantr_09383 [Candida viswanathii]|uniref:Uncharacterized protein n=1 Tax=Candida viswanathii TaxID=5486 RepID=A0A367YBA1_9ASCO|nr:hypothetical protein Cantr_09383 [Candida viswanathii]
MEETVADTEREPQVKDILGHEIINNQVYVTVLFDNGEVYTSALSTMERLHPRLTRRYFKRRPR